MKESKGKKKFKFNKRKTVRKKKERYNFSNFGKKDRMKKKQNNVQIQSTYPTISN